MVRRTGLRQVPWQSWEHWVWVADGIFSGCNERIAAAQNRIKAWQGRGNVPISVETTGALINIQQRDPHFNHELLPECGLPEDMLRMMYAMAIQRLVNGVVDVSGQRKSSSVATRADSAGLPRLLVDIRHETAHNELPGLPLLRSASEQALGWLKAHYWDSQRQVLGDVREELKKKLLEHCQLVTDILTPISKPDDEGNSQDDGEDKQPLVKVMRSMRNIHKRNLKAMKQKRAKLFQDLEELCLSSTSELVSILVDDGFLEQDVLPGVEGRNHAEMESEDSDTLSFDLAAATYTAWRYTICHLSNQLPRLPAMLLVGIVKRLGSCCTITGRSPDSVFDATRSIATFFAPALSLKAPSLSLAPTESSDENENRYSSSAGQNRLIAWCTWLLGSEDSGASLDSISQEAVKSKTLGISRKLSVKVDLNDELCRELLRSCLYLTSTRRPLVELVSLIALKVGSNKLQKQALMLSKFGSIVHGASGSNHKLDNKAGRVSVLGSADSLRDNAAGEAMESSIPCPDQSQKLERIITASDLDGSYYEKARRQQQEFLARATSEGNAAGRSRFDGEDTEEEDDSRIAASEGGFMSQTQGSNRSRVLQGRKWTVAENWRPCALGMIPSPCSVIGILPPLDFADTAEADKKMSDRQATGGESHSRQQHVEDTGKDRVAVNAALISVETYVGKRKSDVEPSSPTGVRRAKITGRHVHFSVTNEVTRNASGSPAAKQMTGSKIQGSRAEQLLGGFLLQGCLRWHGHFTHVSPQQLDSLKSAVHVL